MDYSLTTKTMKRLNKLCAYFHSTNLYDCPKCKVKLRDFHAELRAKVDAVPVERKQALIDAFKDGHTVGEAIAIVDPNNEIEFIVWSNIIRDQIEKNEYMTFNPVVNGSEELLTNNKDNEN